MVIHPPFQNVFRIERGNGGLLNGDRHKVTLFSEQVKPSRLDGDLPKDGFAMFWAHISNGIIN